MMRMKTHLFECYVIGSEIAPCTQKIHYQAYCESKKAYTLGEIKKIIDPKGHFEVAYSNERECINYCTKDGMVIDLHMTDDFIKRTEEEDVLKVFE